MNHRLSRILLGVAILPALMMLEGCASNRKLITLSPVGPSSHGSGRGSGLGELVVFSASRETPARDGAMTYPHSAYKIYNERKACVRRVANCSGAHGEIPAQVELPPGNYRVVAESDEKGAVIVPVIIEPHLETVVHLEAPAHTISRSAATPTN